MKKFKTDDGYLLTFDPGHWVWSDGDLIFQADKDGYPLDHTGKWLEGVMVCQEDLPGKSD